MIDLLTDIYIYNYKFVQQKDKTTSSDTKSINQSMTGQ